MTKKKEVVGDEAEGKILNNEQEIDSQDVVDKSQNFLQKNKNVLIIAAAAVVIIVGAIFYFISAQKAAESEATLALSRVMPFYQQNDFERALNGDQSVTVRGAAIMGLKTIADEYGSTDAGKVAGLLAGNALIATQKPADAERYFDIAASAGAEDIKAGATAGIAACKEFEGKFDEAASQYEKAAQIAILDVVKSRYQYYAGMCYEKAGNKEKAEQIYKDLVEEFQTTEFAASAKKGLTRLGTIIE